MFFILQRFLNRYVIKWIIVLLASLVSFENTNAQITQIVKGTVRDKETQVPLPGATVSLENSTPINGTTTDLNGNFKLNVPVGRQNIRVSFMGYETYLLREIIIGSGKEVILNIDLQESSIKLNEVQVRANSNKEKPLNTMATLSARQLNVEEANRYAGGFDDPARLASTFAGVAGNLQNNGIVIRGNAPKGMLWRMDGVEISTPTHFANITTFGGGGITALSSQMLANSDFFTGAFPAEYGNALSGVFDLKLRTGNNEKNEFTMQAGIMGLDFSAEGPFSKNTQASYLFNYRYSTFSLLSPFMPADAGGIRYQDLCFKLNFPTLKTGTFSFWGIGALDKNPQYAEKDSTLWISNQDKEEGKNNLGMGALGLNHKIILSPSVFASSSLAVSGNILDHTLARMDHTLQLNPLEKVAYNNWKYTFSTTFNFKITQGLINRTGFIADELMYTYNFGQSARIGQPLNTVVDEKMHQTLVHAFSQNRYALSSRTTLNAGLYYQYFTGNHKSTVEPRMGINYEISPKHSVSFAFGSHSQLEMLQIYMTRVPHGNGYTQPNKNLDFTKALHFVFGYEWLINSNMHLKIEPYYQRLYNVPVVPNSSFSLINLDKNWFITDSLVNKGTGTNKGIDITFERFLHKGYYYLLTASLFDSKYKGGDGVEHNTRYNKKFVLNVLGGKEWNIRNNLLSINGKITYMGGDRISPLDYQASMQNKDAVYDETRAFADSKPNVLYADFTINYKINKRQRSGTWSLKIINLLGVKEYAGYRYNIRENRMEQDAEAIVVPNVSYKIEF